MTLVQSNLAMAQRLSSFFFINVSATAAWVSLSETGADEILLRDSPRFISLVPGRTYSIFCHSEGTEGIEWSQNGVVVMVTSLASGVSGIYISSGDARILMLQLFSESLVGQYTCRDGNEEFIIHITTVCCHCRSYRGADLALWHPKQHQ